MSWCRILVTLDPALEMTRQGEPPENSVGIRVPLAPSAGGWELSPLARESLLPRPRGQG